MHIKNNSHYWNKFFRTKMLVSVFLALIPSVLLFTNIFLYAKIAVFIICLIPFFIAYLLIYSPYKKFINTLSFPSKRTKVNLFKDTVLLNGNRIKMYQLQFCDDPSLNKLPCEFVHITTDDTNNVDCFLLDDGKAKHVSVINDQESIMAIVRISDRS